MDAQGNETSVSFTVNFDQTKLSNPVATIGNGVPASSSLGTNALQAASGRLGVLVDSVNTYAPGTRQVMTIRFDVAANAPTGLVPVSFGGAPTNQSISSSLGALLAATYQPGNVNIAPTFSIMGRVLTPSGLGLRNAVVSLTDSTGITQVATTGSFGAYVFINARSGESYTLTVSSRRYRFVPRTIVATGNLTEIDLIGLE